jgi:hypothetical protein
MHWKVRVDVLGLGPVDHLRREVDRGDATRRDLFDEVTGGLAGAAADFEQRFAGLEREHSRRAAQAGPPSCSAGRVLIIPAFGQAIERTRYAGRLRAWVCLRQGIVDSYNYTKRNTGEPSRSTGQE